MLYGIIGSIEYHLSTMVHEYQSAMGMYNCQSTFFYGKVLQRTWL